MSTRYRTRHTPPPPGRRALSQMTLPVAIAFVVVTLLTLTFRVLSAVTGLVAEISERIADAGEVARAAARGATLVTTAARGGAA